MTELLAAIETLPAISALKNSFIAYPVVNALHVLSIGALITSVLLMDLRLLGAFAFVPPAPLLDLLRRVALFGFVGAALTGGTMFAVRARDYAASPVFLLKMALICAGILNFALFYRLQARSPKADEPQMPLRLSAMLSALLWLGVLFAGRFIGFY